MSMKTIHEYYVPSSNIWLLHGIFPTICLMHSLCILTEKHFEHNLCVGLAAATFSGWCWNIRSEEKSTYLVKHIIFFSSRIRCGVSVLRSEIEKCENVSTYQQWREFIKSNCWNAVGVFMQTQTHTDHVDNDRSHVQNTLVFVIPI